MRSALPPASRSLARAEAWYRCLLRLYPATFRRSYEREMLLTFRECYRDLLQHADGQSRLHFWRVVLRDLVVTICSEQSRALVALCKRLLGIERNFDMSSLLHLDVAALTDIGQKREVNEDALVSIIPPEQDTLRQKGALFVVADGLGGHNRGEVASDLAVTVTRETYYASEESDTLARLRQAVEAANQAICQRNAEVGEQEDKSLYMGTTCVAAVLKGDRLYLANAGDSLAYLVRDQSVQQLAQNHSWEQEQVRLGTMTLEQAKAQEKGNVITRCLGDKLDLEVYTTSGQVEDGDVLLLCTDGLHGLVSEDEIRQTVQQYGSAESAERLVALANERGGRDNITALVVRVSLVV